ncbi:phosphotransferase [Paeniglutamicibacter cryotolerans]|uniref:phosphotransferase n=1 Tax=Paeniglutamicibacter cryotolerans TaxID=670079 RepID=UPI001C860A22|nr:phosphotransferase [Paeniglutamicibacter cryotolerans]
MPESAAAESVVGWSEREQLDFFSSGELLALLSEVSSGVIGGDPDVSLVEVHHRPGAGVSGVFEVVGDAETIYLGATAEKLPRVPEGTVTLEGPNGRVVVWLHPADPMLPGLGLATTPEAVGETWGGGRRLEDLRTLTYRPLRRAVMLARFDDGEELFLKVLRRDAAVMHAKHEMLLAVGIPAPVPAGLPVAEVLALRRVAGMPLAEDLMHSGVLPLSPERIVALLDSLPQGLMDVPVRESWSDRLEWYVLAAVTALPAAEQRIRALGSRIDVVLDSARRGPLVPSHGDFYEANIFVAGGKITGLLDIDSAGPGYLVDDLACFIGHLAVLPGIDGRYVDVDGYLNDYARAFASELERRDTDPAGFYARSAAVVLSLVAGARDEEDPDWETLALDRIVIAEELLRRA